MDIEKNLKNAPNGNPPPFPGWSGTHPTTCQPYQLVPVVSHSESQAPTITMPTQWCPEAHQRNIVPQLQAVLCQMDSAMKQQFQSLSQTSPRSPSSIHCVLTMLFSLALAILPTGIVICITVTLVSCWEPGWFVTAGLVVACIICILLVRCSVKRNKAQEQNCVEYYEQSIANAVRYACKSASSTCQDYGTSVAMASDDASMTSITEMASTTSDIKQFIVILFANAEVPVPVFSAPIMMPLQPPNYGYHVDPREVSGVYVGMQAAAGAVVALGSGNEPDSVTQKYL